MTAEMLAGVIIALPLCTYVCAKVAAKTWFNEKLRYHHKLMSNMQEDISHGT